MTLLVTVVCVAVLFTGLGYANLDDNKDSGSLELEDDSDMLMESANQKDFQQNEKHEQPAEESRQSFYPSFQPFENPPLGHSRPFFFQQERAYSQRSIPDFSQQFNFDSSPRFSGYKGDNAYRQSEVSSKQDILGSGNFGVIKGGTFYTGSGGGSSGYENDFDSYYKNGHGRPSTYYGGNPRPQKQEQFANFRDFADINAPANTAFSHYVIMYTDKNETKPDEKATVNHVPKNIIERLAQIDLEASSTTEKVPEKKLSKSKRKLRNLAKEKKYTLTRTKSVSKDLTEPLLALN